MVTPDDAPTPEEELRLYRERERARGSSSDCDPRDLALTADTDPVAPTEKCDDPEDPSHATFLPPHAAPGDTEGPDLLPDPISVASREARSTCFDSGDLVLLAGSYTSTSGATASYTSTSGATADAVTNLVTKYTSTSGATADAVTNLVTKTSHGVTADQPLRFTTLTDGEGLSTSETYYARDILLDTFAVALTPGGSAVVISVNYTVADYYTSHGVTADQPIRFTTLTDGEGLSTSTTYYARDILLDTFAVALTPDGDAVVISVNYTVADYESEYVAERGEDTQLVYLDEIEEIPQEELFRLSSYGVALQAHADADLIAAIDGADFTAFDAELVDITNTPAVIATAIREALVLAQTIADDVAQTLADSAIVCGYFNKELWVKCESSEAAGYVIVYSEPVSGEFAHIAAGLFSSEDNQLAADTQAGQNAAVDLSCLFTNTTQYDKNCGDVHEDYDDQFEWPTTTIWALNPTPTSANPTPTKTLESQGVDSWDDDAWNSANTNLISTRTLADLNGQEFMSISAVGSNGIRRTLRSRYIVAVNDPRTAAPTQAEANEIAENLALQELDCFFPNRPRVVSCVTPLYGSTGTGGVIDRMSESGLSDTLAHRNTLFGELNGDSRTNEGVTNFGSTSENTDSTLAFEVWVWPGFFAGDTPDEVDAKAGNYGKGFTQCSWVSPTYSCMCHAETATQIAAVAAGTLSEMFEKAVVDLNHAKLDEDRSNEENSLPRGLFLSKIYPGPDIIADAHSPTAVWHTIVEESCLASLSCLYYACKVAYCEPKPDDRPFKVNGMPNWASYGVDWLGEPSSQGRHDNFIAEWEGGLSAALTADFGSGSICAGHGVNADWDACGGATNPPAHTGDDQIVHWGPGTGSTDGWWGLGGQYGMPARFKYGGILLWGRRWTDPSTPGGGYGENDPPGEGASVDASAGAVGTVKGCSQIDLDPEEGVFNVWQDPHPWGYYHGAEGQAEAYTPVGLGDQASVEAISRLDCTHISWPRHMLNCPQPSQRPFGHAGIHLGAVMEGSSTREADESLESLLLDMMECQDAHSWMIAIEAGDGGVGAGSGATICMLAPAIMYTGDDGYHPKGVSQAYVVDEFCTPMCPCDMDADESVHYIVEVVYCELIAGDNCDDPDRHANAKGVRLHIVADSNMSGDDIREAKQLGELGMAAGRDKVAEIRAAADPESEFYYIGSLYVGDLGEGKDSNNADRVIVQAHTGPIIIGYPASSCTPWKVTYINSAAPGETADWDINLSIGTISGVVATNWDDDFGVPNYDAQYFVISEVSFNSAIGAVTSHTLSLATSPPPAVDLDPVNKDTPPTSLKVILGTIKAGRSCMAYDENLIALAVEKLRTSKGSVPSAGLEPFDRWWGWNIYEGGV